MSTFEMVCWIVLVVWCVGALAFVLLGIGSNRRASCSESDALVAEAEQNDRKPGDGF